jgi:phospholipid/cholesterol/gamma-HCH transport system ATP-binding protein
MAILMMKKRREPTEIGMVFQGSALFDSMTVAETCCFSLKMFTRDNKAKIKERVDFVLNRVALTDAHNKLPSEIWMKKRWHS